MKESGCAVLEAVLTGNIAESRHGSYVKLLERTSQIPSWKRKKMDTHSSTSIRLIASVNLYVQGVEGMSLFQSENSFKNSL